MDSPVELTEDEVCNIVTAFKDMNTKPNADSPNAFKEWMKEFSRQNQPYTGYIPRLPTFSGDNKGDNCYDVWRYQVLCLIVEHHTHEAIAQAVRRSLRGEPSKIVMRLGPKATVDDIIDKMDSIYGIVDPKEALLAQFYTARQEPEETVSAWGLRLEDIFNKAKRQGKIYEEDTDMLRSMFWKGLKPELKKISGYHFDTITDFNQLLVAMRELEYEREQRRKEALPEQNTSKKPIPAKRKKTKAKESDDNKKTKTKRKESDDTKALIQRLMTQIDFLEKRNTDMDTSKRTNQDHTFYDETITYRPWNRDKRKQQDEITCWRCGQLGHIAIGCKVRLDNCKKVRAMNFQQVSELHEVKPGRYEGSKEDQLCGPATEVTTTINGIQTKALLDTGSTVSTISETFYRKHLSSTPIEPLTRILKIECADGQPMPYHGYIEASCKLHGIPSTQPYPSIFLIVPDSDYNSHVPLLIGTNIMARIMEDLERTIGPRYLQESKLHTPYYLAFRALAYMSKELTKRNYRLAVIKSAEHRNITIPANSEVIINGYLDKQLQHHRICAILQPTQNSVLPEDLDIVPTVITYDHKDRGNIQVHISNVTTRTVTVPPRSLLCEIQPVSIEDTITSEEPQFKDIMKDIKIPVDTITDDEYRRGKELIHQYQDIFSTRDDDIGHTSAVRHRIDLLDDHPFSVTEEFHHP